MNDVGVVSDVGQERLVMPAAFNRNRLAVLRQQFRHYHYSHRYLQKARTEQERLSAEARVVEAIAEYNEVAETTDPSAFASTLLPRRLPRE